MKKIILILVIFLLGLTGCGEKRVEDMSKLELRDGINYVIGEKKPYTGITIWKHLEGNGWVEMKYKKGIAHGVRKNYYGDGKTLGTTYYIYGKRYGYEKTYWANGNVRTSVFYIYEKK